MIKERCSHCGNMVVGEFAPSTTRKYLTGLAKKGGMKAVLAAVGSVVPGFGNAAGFLVGGALDLIYGDDIKKFIDKVADEFDDNKVYVFDCPQCGHSWAKKEEDIQSLADVAHQSISPDGEDITVMVCSKDYIYFCFGGTGQKIRIPFERFGKNPTIVQLNDAVDELKIPPMDKSGSPHPVYSYMLGSPAFIKNMELGIVLYSSNPKSYLKAMELSDKLKIGAFHIAHIGALGKYGLKCALCSDEELLIYRFSDQRLDIEIGDGVFEIREHVKGYGHYEIDQKDVIKGILYRVGIWKGLITDLLLLEPTGMEIKFLLSDGARVIYEEVINDKNATSPFKKNMNFRISAGTTLIIKLNDVEVAKKRGNDSIIEWIEVLPDGNINMIINQDSRIKSLSLHNFIYSE
ncbi:MAG: hypothetical protein HDS95_00740 [Bacteroidales bacterium]|nr:hypothetical protein [Bacteroidales bacterium]MBD5386931.1 hypothetical protein [bacterium]